MGTLTVGLLTAEKPQNSTKDKAKLLVNVVDQKRQGVTGLSKNNFTLDVLSGPNLGAEFSDVVIAGATIDSVTAARTNPSRYNLFLIPSYGLAWEGGNYSLRLNVASGQTGSGQPKDIGQTVLNFTVV